MGKIGCAVGVALAWVCGCASLSGLTGGDGGEPTPDARAKEASDDAGRAVRDGRAEASAKSDAPRDARSTDVTSHDASDAAAPPTDSGEDHTTQGQDSGSCDGSGCCHPEALSMACGAAGCGQALNNCGQTVSCGTCSASSVCVSGSCCTPMACAQGFCGQMESCGMSFVCTCLAGDLCAMPNGICVAP
jgi:hypothetical protein